jgi:hypothetical protein
MYICMYVYGITAKGEMFPFQKQFDVKVNTHVHDFLREVDI